MSHTTPRGPIPLLARSTSMIMHDMTPMKNRPATSAPNFFDSASLKLPAPSFSNEVSSRVSEAIVELTHAHVVETASGTEGKSGSSSVSVYKSVTDSAHRSRKYLLASLGGSFAFDSPGIRHNTRIVTKQGRIEV